MDHGLDAGAGALLFHEEDRRALVPCARACHQRGLVSDFAEVVDNPECPTPYDDGVVTSTVSAGALRSMGAMDEPLVFFLGATSRYGRCSFRRHTEQPLTRHTTPVHTPLFLTKKLQKIGVRKAIFWLFVPSAASGLTARSAPKDRVTFIHVRSCCAPSARSLARCRS